MVRGLLNCEEAVLFCLCQLIVVVFYPSALRPFTLQTNAHTQMMKWLADIECGFLFWMEIVNLWLKLETSARFQSTHKHFGLAFQKCPRTRIELLSRCCWIYVKQREVSEKALGKLDRIKQINGVKWQMIRFRLGRCAGGPRCCSSIHPPIGAFRLSTIYVCEDRKEKLYPVTGLCVAAVNFNSVF